MKEKIIKTKSIDKKLLQNFKDNQWTHEVVDACLIFAYPSAEACCLGLKNKFIPFKYIVSFYNYPQATWHYRQVDNSKITNEIIQKSLKKPNFSKLLIKKWQGDKRLFYDLYKKYILQDFNNYDLKTLGDIYLKIYNAYIEAISLPYIIDAFYFEGNKVLEDSLRTFLENKKQEKNFIKYFEILTKPVAISFIASAEKELIEKILLLIKKDKKLTAALKNKNYKKAEKILKNNKQVYKKLFNYTEKYKWIRNNYLGSKKLNTEYWLKEIAEILISKKNLANQLYQLNLYQRNRLQKSRLERQLKLPKDIRTLIRLVENLTYWQDERKKTILHGIEIFSKFLDVLAFRFNIDLILLKHLTPPEILLVLYGKQRISIQELKLRKKGCVFVWTSNGCLLAQGAGVKKINRKIFEEEVKLQKEIKGIVASTGKVKGVVKIVEKVGEISKVEKGEILVARMTRPDYIAGIKKAAAIITDEGGITCHAAIVSREMKIPCIIGAKIATKILKDGDLVEVDANKGIVKILKNK
jgi:phosphohistidine swiveling domain-containing protein